MIVGDWWIILMNSQVTDTHVSHDSTIFIENLFL